MRIIKFRAFDKDKQEMFEVGAMTYADEKFGIVVDDLEWNMRKDVELMQFTGLHDKNGKKVYEGDVLDWNTGESEARFDVKWNSKRAGWFLAGILPIDVETNCEIIGNVFVNPELSGRTE